MVIVMQEGATDAQIQHVIDRLVASGFNVHRSTGESHTVLGAVGVHRDFDHRDFELLDGVREVMRITQPFKLASRQFKPEGPIVDLGRGVKIGGPEVAIAAGPCSVESREQIFSVAESVAKAGAKILRGGAFKPRTSPYAFQGMGEPGLKLMREAADKFGLFTISEVMDASQIQMMLGYVDIFQVGARSSGGWCGWLAHRSAQRSRPRPLRWRAISRARPIRATHGRTPYHRPRHRPPHCVTMPPGHLISRVTILGTGLIGGSFALALRKYTTGIRICGWDRADVVREAQSRGALDEVFSGELAPALHNADLIYIALPIAATIDLLPELARHAPPDSLVTAPCSTKLRIALRARATT